MRRGDCRRGRGGLPVRRAERFVEQPRQTGNPMDPHVLAAIERIAAAAKANGKPWGVLSKTEEFALKCRKLGCQLFSIAGDLDYISRGIAATKSQFPAFSNSQLTGK